MSLPGPVYFSPSSVNALAAGAVGGGASSGALSIFPSSSPSPMQWPQVRAGDAATSLLLPPPINCSFLGPSGGGGGRLVSRGRRRGKGGAVVVVVAQGVAARAGAGDSNSAMASSPLFLSCSPPAAAAAAVHSTSGACSAGAGAAAPSPALLFPLAVSRCPPVVPVRPLRPAAAAASMDIPEGNYGDINHRDINHYDGTSFSPDGDAAPLDFNGTPSAMAHASDPASFTGSFIQTPSIYVPFNFYKSRTALEMRPLRPTFRRATSVSGYEYIQRAREGSVLLTFAKARGTRLYDWNAKGVFAVSVMEMGRLVALKPGGKEKFFHDPNMNTPDQGQVTKSLEVNPTPDPSEGYFLNLTVRNGKTGNKEDKFSIMLTHPEFGIMTNLMKHVMPYCIGWDVWMHPTSLSDSMFREK